MRIHTTDPHAQASICAKHSAEQPAGRAHLPGGVGAVHVPVAPMRAQQRVPGARVGRQAERGQRVVEHGRARARAAPRACRRPAATCTRAAPAPAPPHACRPGSAARAPACTAPRLGLRCSAPGPRGHCVDPAFMHVLRQARAGAAGPLPSCSATQGTNSARIARTGNRSAGARAAFWGDFSRANVPRMPALPPPHGACVCASPPGAPHTGQAHARGAHMPALA